MAYTAIDDPEAYFQVKTYSGTGSSNAQTFDGDEDMQPDLVWIKNREQALNYMMFDAVRGTTKYFYSNLTEAEGTNDPATILTAFGSDGFTVGANNNVNQSSNDIVAWCWKESATAGFDIVTYTGNGTDDTDISHNLSAVPKMIIVKNRDAADAWQMYHGANTSAPETDYLVLNDSAATADAVDRWSDEAPTSSVFTLGDGAEVNTDTENYIAYCFAPKQGYSAMGSYIGNGNADGTFVFTGMRPAMVILKKTSGAALYYLHDNKRNPYNVMDKRLYIDNPAVEASANELDFLSNGFKLRSTETDINGSGSSYVYMVWAEAPFVNSNGVPCNAR
jgi:hypothetical protein